MAVQVENGGEGAMHVWCVCAIQGVRRRRRRRRRKKEGKEIFTGQLIQSERYLTSI